jgi:ribosomal protein S18 acetylase RimI-like enzyme
MSESAYLRYLDESIAYYANDLVLGKIATEEGASEKLRSDLSRLLPQGLDTPNNFFFEVQDENTNQVVGYFWYTIQTKLGNRLAFISDIWIKPEFQRQGYATNVFGMFEDRMKELEIVDVGLHVFGHNKKARALYEKLGYAPTSMQMRKTLTQDTPLNS